MYSILNTSRFPVEVKTIQYEQRKSSRSWVPNCAKRSGEPRRSRKWQRAHALTAALRVPVGNFAAASIAWYRSSLGSKAMMLSALALDGIEAPSLTAWACIDYEQLSLTVAQRAL